MYIIDICAITDIDLNSNTHEVNLLHYFRETIAKLMAATSDKISEFFMRKSSDC